MSTTVRFNGRAGRDSLATPPILGVWYVGDPAPNVPETTPTFTELVFDGALCSAAGQQCRQIKSRACKLGDECDHFAKRFVAQWNAALDPSKTYAPPIFEIAQTSDSSGDDDGAGSDSPTPGDSDTAPASGPASDVAADASDSSSQQEHVT